MNAYNAFSLRFREILTSCVAGAVSNCNEMANDCEGRDRQDAMSFEAVENQAIFNLKQVLDPHDDHREDEVITEMQRAAIRDLIFNKVQIIFKG